MSKRVVTFGEIMLRLAPNGYYRFFQDDQLQATFGGGEANVAVSLANYGLDAAFVTKLPAHAIGQGAVNALRGLGVDTSGIVRGGERVGIYFLEKGASQRGSVCIYDRAYSAIQQAKAEDFDWDSIPDSQQVEIESYCSRQPHLHLEPDCGYGYIDEDGMITVHSKSIGIHLHMPMIADGCLLYTSPSPRDTR